MNIIVTLRQVIPSGIPLKNNKDEYYRHGWNWFCNGCDWSCNSSFVLWVHLSLTCRLFTLYACCFIPRIRHFFKRGGVNLGDWDWQWLGFRMLFSCRPTVSLLLVRLLRYMQISCLFWGRNGPGWNSTSWLAMLFSFGLVPAFTRWMGSRMPFSSRWMVLVVVAVIPVRLTLSWGAASISPSVIGWAVRLVPTELK